MEITAVLRFCHCHAAPVSETGRAGHAPSLHPVAGGGVGVVTATLPPNTVAYITFNSLHTAAPTDWH